VDGLKMTTSYELCCSGKINAPFTCLLTKFKLKFGEKTKKQV